MELNEEDLLEDDLLRSKRSVKENLSVGASQEISNIGEFLYPSEFENSATKQSGKEFSNLGEFLYAGDYESNKLNEDASDFDDYSANLLRETKEINFKDKTRRTEDDFLGTYENVSVILSNCFVLLIEYAFEMRIFLLNFFSIHPALNEFYRI